MSVPPFVRADVAASHGCRVEPERVKWHHPVCVISPDVTLGQEHQIDPTSSPLTASAERKARPRFGLHRMTAPIAKQVARGGQRFRPEIRRGAALGVACPRMDHRPSSGGLTGATATVARETHSCFQGRLRRGYSRFGDARPRPSPNREWMLSGSSSHTNRGKPTNGSQPTASARLPVVTSLAAEGRRGYQTGTCIGAGPHLERPARIGITRDDGRSAPYDVP